MNGGTLKGYPEKPVPGLVVTANSNGRVGLGASENTTTTNVPTNRWVTSISSFIKWGG